jgi:hypothetical protein
VLVAWEGMMKRVVAWAVVIVAFGKPIAQLLLVLLDLIQAPESMAGLWHKVAITPADAILIAIGICGLAYLAWSMMFLASVLVYRVSQTFRLYFQTNVMKTALSHFLSGQVTHSRAENRCGRGSRYTSFSLALETTAVPRP